MAKKTTLEETRLEEAAKLRAHEKMLVESVFNTINEVIIPRESPTIEAFVRGQITELTIYGKKYKVVSDTFVENVTKQMEIMVEKSKKDNILMESRIKSLEKYVTGSAMITERVEKNSNATETQIKQLEKTVQRLLRDITQLRLEND